MIAVSALLITMAVVNIVAFTWTIAMEARPSLAVARTLGATPGQVSAGLSIAQLLPCLPGAAVGVPLGIGVFSALSPGNAVVAPLPWMLVAALATLLVTAALTALPAHLAARRPVVPVLSADTA
ncbi:FtsX-like permease family protein [Nonomuraea endophytica]|uniref:ABC-type lipoprotein release transport system permease subunit n=1 Tax=Nonomuraea endophytica TaxID=714136 RepID=A0A7W8EHL0_9ACTN|nr:FtsX-like permease family protein [Nonomuraea endophytica]MBB5079541.1 ABC-type lipoprotein release transport system permease subunit [Nonomuraea endophytica]